MQRWWYMLGGLLVWAAHFVGVYAIASIGDVVAQADHPTWRMIGLGFSALCFLAVLALLFQAFRRRDDGGGVVDLSNAVARLGALLAMISIVWQTLPTLI